jgi:hypothetical protein
VAGQDDILRSIILEMAPSDGSNIGNQTLLGLLQDRAPASPRKPTRRRGMGWWMKWVAAAGQNLA